jgi:hypothetical protein
MDIPYERREFTAGNVVGETLALYRRFFIRFSSIGLVVYLVINLPTALAVTTNSDTARALWLVIAAVFAFVGSFWLSGAFAVQVDDARDGKIDIPLLQLFGRTRERLPYLAAAGVLFGLAAGAVAVAAIVFGTVAGVAWLGILVAVNRAACTGDEMDARRPGCRA